MKFPISIFLSIIFSTLILTSGELAAQTKLTTGNQLIYKLGTSSQLAKEQWEFQFADDNCLFIKTKKYKERDGTLKSSFSVNIPLAQVNIELEIKSYDSFFQCIDGKNCITRTWQKADGEVTESKETDTASLLIKNASLAADVYNQFSYLRTLCDRSNYPGPSGIKWGDSKEAATPVLSTRFKFEGERTTQNGALFRQTYLDSFAGYGTDKIQVGYVDNKFYEMLVIPEIKPKESLAKKWYDVVNTIINKYGDPNQIVLPQSIKSLKEITNERYFKDFSVFDLEIREGHWHPSALWKYKNSAQIIVEVVPAEIDWEVHWQFLHKDLQKLAEVRIAEHPVDDF